MTKKPKKTLDDVAAQFIFGNPDNEDTSTPSVQTKLPQSDSLGLLEKLKNEDTSTPSVQTKLPQSDSSGLLEKLKKEPQQRVKPIRVSLDLDPEMHQRLTELANRLGRKKSEVLRILITQALAEIE